MAFLFLQGGSMEQQILDRLTAIEKRLGIQSTTKDVPKHRRALHDIVAKYCNTYDLGFDYAWMDLYRMCRLYMHIDFVERAKNKNVRPIDYICGNGYLNEVIDVAKKELV